MTATKLTIYNGALLLLDERLLLTLTDGVETRRKLDSVWDRGGINYVLEQGQWNFAMRTTELDYSDSLEASFGYQRVYEKPDDLVRLVALCHDEYFSVPLLEYHSETGYWFADIDPLYIRYVSDGSSYGGDYSNWPESFTRYVEAYFAYSIAPTKKKKAMYEIMNDTLRNAMSKDAVGSPTVFPPKGAWQRARDSGGNGSDRGRRNQLIG